LAEKKAASKKQVQYLMSLLAELEPGEYAKILQRYGVKRVADLDAEAASKLIDELTGKSAAKQGEQRVIIEMAQPAKVRVQRYKDGSYQLEISYRTRELSEALEEVIAALSKARDELEFAERVSEEDVGE